MVSVRKAIFKRLREMKKSRFWLARESGIHPSMVYTFFAGKRGVSVETAEKMLGVLGLEIRPKGSSAGRSTKAE